MKSEDEDVDKQGFEEAIRALTTTVKITAMQQAAKETVSAEISLCYSKLQGSEHKLIIIVHPEGEVTVESRAILGLKLQRLLSYEGIYVLTDNLLSPFDSNYSSYARVTPDNMAGLRNFVAEYVHYIGEDSLLASSPAYDEFVDLLKESDSTEQEKLLRRLAEDCEVMGIELDVHVKRPRVENP
jgi:hypothetical protein